MVLSKSYNNSMKDPKSKEPLGAIKSVLKKQK